MSAYFVRKISPTADAVSGAYPGVHVDASTPEEAVSLFGALPGHALSVGDQCSVVAIAGVVFRSLQAQPPAVGTVSPPTVPPVGS